MAYLCFQKSLLDFVSSKTTHTPTRHLHQRQSLCFCTFLQTWNISSWERVREFINLKESALFLLALGNVSRNYKTRKILLLLCMYRYTFSFTLKLKAALLQKLPTFYMKNIKQKDEGICPNCLN